MQLSYGNTKKGPVVVPRGLWFCSFSPYFVRPASAESPMRACAAANRAIGTR